MVVNNSIKGTRKNTSGSTTIYNGDCNLKRILIGDAGDGCLLTVYDDTTVKYRCLLSNDMKNIDFEGMHISTSLKVTLSDLQDYRWYPLDSHPSGNTVHDKSSNASNAVAGNCSDSNWVEGMSFGALELNGSDERINCGDIADWLSDDAFSISLWWRTDGLGSLMPLFQKSGNFDAYLDNNGGYTRGCVRIFGKTGNINIKAYDTWAGGIRWDSQQWHHFCFTYDGSEDAQGLKIYIDGRRVGGVVTGNNISATSEANSNSLYFGCLNTNWFDGRLDEIRMFERELSEKEILYLYGMRDGAEINVDNSGTPTHGYNIADITVIYEE